jgi:hypothetical protein
VAVPSGYLRGFQGWALRNVDFDTIRQWLVTDGAKYAGQDFQWKFPSEFPKCLIESKPDAIVVRTEPSGDLTVCLCWGRCLWSQYGVVVGPANMKTPEVGKVRISPRTDEFRRPVQPGAYVFHCWH